MRNTTKWIVAVAVANVLLLPLTFAPDTKAVAAQPVAASNLHDCCKGSAGRASFCCRKCCWQRSGCDECLPAAVQR